MNAEERHEQLIAVIEELAEASAETPVIVEGERDVKSLRALGVRGEVLPLNRGTTVFAACERVAATHREAILLTDWDVRGGQLARLLRDGLAANGVRCEESFRARIAYLCQKEIKAVEDLHGYVERIAPRGENGRRRPRSSRTRHAGPVSRRG